MLRIKRVVIKGFKTFAQQTEFVFDPGVTAIVGPNGSGKSNVADAVRWCLGEQSFGLLRSKKTVDVIFSGSDKRARLGMAMVSLVLDNSAGELHIDFSEVEITRRAYRDGDNEYLLNGQRARLQDITQLLAPGGLGKRMYAVIGQGLIDRALNLKPEERRALFEEAAGITGYQQKRAAALRRLEATQQNLERAHDILTELSPRLHYLKRQADRARERQQVETDLKDLLHTWYGYRWRRALTRLQEARLKVQQDERATQNRLQRLADVTALIGSLRARRTSLRVKLNERRLIISACGQQAEEVSRRLAVTQERHRQTVARHKEQKRECSELRTERKAIEARLTILGAEVEEAQNLRHESQNALERLQSRLSERKREQSVYQQRRRETENALHEIEKRITDRRSRLEQLAERRDTMKRTLAQAQERISAAQQAADHAAATLSTAEADSVEHGAQLEETQSAIAAPTQRIAALDSALWKEEEGRQQAERDVVRIQTRLDLLQPLLHEKSYASGVRSVLQASQSGELNGILGTVASQLYVPARLERAIEVALGGALQNVITRTWQDAQDAIEQLKRSAGGRATFLPLDRLRAGEPIPAPKQAGIQGNAKELVNFCPHVAPAMEQLLQRVWIADDLTAARQALDTHADARRPGRRANAAKKASSSQGRWKGALSQPTVVTLDGEIIRPGGAVTGGNDNRKRQGSVLAREREMRELPLRLARATEKVRLAADNALAIRRQIEEQRQLRDALEERRNGLLHAARQRQETLEQIRLTAAQARQAANWHTQLFIQSQQNLAELKPQEEELQRELNELIASRQAARHRARLAEQANPFPRLDALLRQLADLRAAAAEAQGHLNSRRAVLAEQRHTLERTDSQFQSKSQRLDDLRQETGRLLEEIEEISVGERSLRAEISRLQQEIEPFETELQQLEAEQAQAEAEERPMQQLLRQDETTRNLSLLALRRAEDRLENLRREIRQDFGLAELEEVEELACQPPLSLQALVTQLPIVDQLPPGLDDEVSETRARLRRLNNVNTEAPKEYEQAAERHRFLQIQADDLEKAARDVRLVIRELDVRMERELRRTFDAVSSEFAHFFRLLLQGGTAQLSITDPDDILNTGIEIVARPPGKRPQSLELLSGGERSLTACALVFAILRVSPTPFCVLDEVDATLDEANVDRFRVALETLSSHTQFILITHNRRTLEGANSIYGITMGDDGVSRVISLRLDGDQMVETS